MLIKKIPDASVLVKKNLQKLKMKHLIFSQENGL